MNNYYSNINYWIKEAYADSLEFLIPDGVFMIRLTDKNYSKDYKMWVDITNGTESRAFSLREKMYFSIFTDLSTKL